MSMLWSLVISTLALSAAPPVGSTEAVARKELRALISALKGVPFVDAGKTVKFSAGGCPKISPKGWASLALLQQPIEHELRFAPGCDLQGKLRITVDPFPIDLALRNLPGVRRAVGRISIGVTPNLFDQEVDLDVDAKTVRGTASDGKDLFGFDSTYGVTLALNGSLKSNRGGKIFMKRHREKDSRFIESLRFE